MTLVVVDSLEVAGLVPLDHHTTPPSLPPLSFLTFLRTAVYLYTVDRG